MKHLLKLILIRIMTKIVNDIKYEIFNKYTFINNQN